MLPFFMAWTPGGYGILTYTGRRSGIRRRKCLRAIRDGQSVYLLMLRPPALAVERPSAVAAWVHNVRANPQVAITLGRHTSCGTIREITDDSERELARVALCDRIHLVDYGECDLHVRGLPSKAKIRALHSYWFDTGVPFAIDLTD
ncbi:MAG: hypothetical protein JWR52_1638 [Marmoricola sp.]|nr:hypothetical protein [Marmoricola sp.]